MRLLLAFTATSLMAITSANQCVPMRSHLGVFKDKMEDLNQRDPLVRLMNTRTQVAFEDRITFFEPTQEADSSFQMLLRGDVGPADESYDQEALMEVIRNHAVYHEMKPIPDGVVATHTTKDKVKMSVTPSYTLLTGFKTGNKVKVVSQAIDTCAGVVYKVDGLMMPQNIACAKEGGVCGTPDAPTCCVNTASTKMECSLQHECIGVGDLEEEDLIPEVDDPVILTVNSSPFSLLRFNLELQREAVPWAPPVQPLDGAVTTQGDTLDEVVDRPAIILDTDDGIVFQVFLGKDYFPESPLGNMIPISYIPDGSKTVADLGECMEFCADTEDCSAASFYYVSSSYGGKNCWLKTILSSCDIPEDAVHDINSVLLLLHGDECPALIPEVSKTEPEDSMTEPEVSMTEAEVSLTEPAMNVPVTTSPPITTPATSTAETSITTPTATPTPSATPTTPPTATPTTTTATPVTRAAPTPPTSQEADTGSLSQTPTVDEDGPADDIPSGTRGLFGTVFAVVASALALF